MVVTVGAMGAGGFAAIGAMGAMGAMGHAAMSAGAAASPVAAGARAGMDVSPSCVVSLSSAAGAGSADTGASGYEGLCASFRAPGAMARNREAGMNDLAIYAPDRALACSNDQIVLALLMLLQQQQGADKPHGFLSNGGA